MRTIALLLTIVIAAVWIQDAGRRRSGSGRRGYITQEMLWNARPSPLPSIPT